eukprot:CAMPEP_0119301632 /NCGR_PEP_ID=MMETSP1333-20130426/3377_1 /TAXON_ID=418940 /ORGANISM="Scyphosphaera apsteinii, Strain RCC1455" /LENGTH=75 /DNA_ID=CAMNT_0007303755 /DNA_START=857 /DNA_END=1082 /DNA_ORIENTATION=+
MPSTLFSPLSTPPSPLRALASTFSGVCSLPHPHDLAASTQRQPMLQGQQRAASSQRREEMGRRGVLQNVAVRHVA